MKRLMVVLALAIAVVFSFSSAYACDFVGCVYCDNDMSGTISEGDDLFAGVDVFIDGANDYTATTDASGCYAVHVSSGSYTVSLDLADLPSDASVILPAVYPAALTCVGGPVTVEIEQNFLIDSETCHPEPYCGDGIVNGDEECEPGVSECGENQICNEYCMCEPVYEGCSRTPGYWKTHAMAWPVESITIGNVLYTKTEAIAKMWMPIVGCKERTMYNALVAAKLNVLSGASDGCIADTINDADAWMAANGGSCVLARSEVWQIGEMLYTDLDNYNNGLLCIPHCE